MSCGCKNKVAGYVDLSKIGAIPWNCAKHILGQDECGQVLILDKPIYEMSAADREKLDLLVVDGRGDMYLADDGTYKYIEFDTDSVVLEYHDRPANFIINNQEELAAVWDKIQEGRECFVRMRIGTVVVPLSYAYGKRSLTLEYDRPMVAVSGKEATYSRMKIMIGMNTDVYPFNLVYYDVKQFADADAVVITEGDGASALYDDGSYRPTYTRMQTDELIAALDAGLTDKLDQHTEDIAALESLTGRHSEQIAELEAATARHTEAITDLEGASARHTEEIAGLEAATDRHTEEIAELASKTTRHTKRIAGLEDRMTEAEAGITAHTESISDLRTSTEAGFTAVNAELDSLGGRVSTNETQIELNVMAIQQLRDDFTNDEKFKGYFADYDEMVAAVPCPTPGDYAWNAETGTVWQYNGTLWFNTTNPIPDQTVTPSDSLPQVPAGTGEVGVSTRYMRADAVIPSDPAKADLAELDRYLPLAGNTQANRMNGSLWMETGQRVHLNHSGTTYIGQNTSSNTLELAGSGTNGVEILAPVGKVRANGEEVVTYDGTDNLHAKGHLVLKNNAELLGKGTDGENYNLAMVSRYGVADFGSSKLPFNINASVRPTVQLSGESGTEAHPLAFTEDIHDAAANLQQQVDDNLIAIVTNRDAITSNRSDIDSILSRLADEENFRGYKLTTAEVTSIANPQNGNYAYNVETGTIWVYNGTTWADSGEAIPDGAIQAFDGQPLMDGEAHCGTSNAYARGDHRHPTDTVLQAAIELVKGETEDLEQKVDTQQAGLQSAIDRVADDLSAHVGHFETFAGDTDEKIAEQAAAIDANASAIDTLRTDFNKSDKFKGYFETNLEITRIPGEQGAYAWSVETGTVWVYDDTLRTWTDSGIAVPDQSVAAYDYAPEMDGTADAGTATRYARGDHRHPTDTTRAAAADLQTANDTMAELSAGFNAYKNSNDQKVSELDAAVAAHTDVVSELTARVGTAEDELSAVQTQAAGTAAEVSDFMAGLAAAEGRIGVNETDIATLFQALHDNENFKGYFLTTDAITDLAGTSGDFAWNGETGTVWVYNGTLLTWQDSGEPIPSGAVTISNNLPLVNGIAAAGGSNEVSRWDHVHPSDPKKADLSAIPTTVSQLSNDAGYITDADIPTDISAFTNDAGYLTSAGIPTAVSDLTNDLGFITDADIPTDISAFNNDAGYLTSAGIPTAVSDLTNDLGFITDADIPTTLSSFTNDSGFITDADLPTEISELNNDAGYITSAALAGYVTDTSLSATLNGYTTTAATDALATRVGTAESDITSLKSDKADVSDLPTAVSQLTNDSGYVTSAALADYVPKATYDALQARVEALETILSGVSGFWTGTVDEYNSLTTKDPDTYYHTYEE